MQRALEDEAFRASLRASAQMQAAKFSWELSARRALSALEELHARSRPQPQPPASPPLSRPLSRPLLAMHAPLPPAQSGIADYTVELVQVLATHYEIELVCDQPEFTLPRSLQNLPVRSTEWFRQHASRYDRIVYQFGNYMFHAHMFALLHARIPRCCRAA